MIRALLFDLDNTLADRTAAFARYCADFCRRHLGHYVPYEQARVVTRMRTIDDLGYRPRDEFCEWVAFHFPDCGLSAAEVWHDHRERLSEFYEPDPAVRRMLQRLARRFRIGVVTNGSGRNQHRKLERIELADLIDNIVISEEAGVAKPEAGIFLAALDGLECGPEEALFIGDDPRADVAGASEAGLDTCWVSLGRRYPVGVTSPDSVIERLLDLEARLPCLMPAR